MYLLDSMLRRAISTGALELRLGSQTRSYGDRQAPAIVVCLADGATASRIGRNPALAAGEAYMDGRLTVENGRILDLLDLVAHNLRFERGNTLRMRLWRQQRLMARFAELNERGRAKRNVAHHYDLDDQLYDLFLDEERQYSCGYFRPGNDGPDSDLDSAQRDKLAHIANKLCLTPDCRVLDIGCGWGGLARHIHAVSGARVLGITLSEEQLRHARARAAALGIDGAVRHELMDFRDVEGRFDRIVSVGMFEHVGRPNYRAYFEKVADLLAPDGIALIHSIGRLGGPGMTDPWMRKYIFPGGYTPALSELAPHLERAFLWLADLEVWRSHYMKTLEHWLVRCTDRRAEIESLYDARFFRLWEFYLAGAITAFRHDDHAVFQLQLARRRDAVPITRDYLCRS